MHYSHPGHCSSSHSRRGIWTWQWWSIIKVLKYLTCPQTGRRRSCWSWLAPCRRWCRRCRGRIPWPLPAGPCPCPGRSAWCRRCRGTGRPCQHYFIKVKSDNRWLFSICLNFLYGINWTDIKHRFSNTKKIKNLMLVSYISFKKNNNILCNEFKSFKSLSYFKFINGWNRNRSCLLLALFYAS